MKTQTVYIEVPVSERLPEDNETKFVKTTLTEWESASFEKDHWDGDLRGDFDNPELVTHWLEKKEDQITMSKAEFEKYISDAFIAGFDSSLMATPNKEEYLTNLIK